MLKDVFTNIVHANGATVLVSAVAIFILALFKEQIDGRLKSRLKMPIPIDLIVVRFYSIYVKQLMFSFFKFCVYMSEYFSFIKLNL